MTINLSISNQASIVPSLNGIFLLSPKVINIIIPKDETQDNNLALLEIRVSIGDLLPITEHHSCRAGVVICTGISKKNAIALAEKVVKSIKIETIN